MQPRTLIGLFGLALLAASPVTAENRGKLPEDAVPMATDKIKEFYAGKSIQLTVAQVYWRPDGAAFGYYPKKGFGEGIWTVKGNEMCHSIDWRGKNKRKEPFRDFRCHKLYVSGNTIWIENTRDEKKTLGDVWTGQEKRLRMGDIVSQNVRALKAKYGYRF